MSKQNINRELNTAVFIAVMLAVGISFILNVLYVQVNLNKYMENIPKKVCTDNISSEVITIEYKIGRSTKIIEKDKVIDYTCTDGMEVYDGGDVLFFEYPISKLGHSPISDIKPETCIVKINNRVCEIK